jgi:single-stranded DNA-binding protein
MFVTQFVARLGNDPEVLTAASGTEYTKVRAAVSMGKDKESIWINVCVYGGLQKVVGLAKKGQLVAFSGSVMSMDAYTPKDGGDPRASLTVAANQFTFCESKDKSNTDASNGEVSQSVVEEFAGHQSSSDEEMPF